MQICSPIQDSKSTGMNTKVKIVRALWLNNKSNDVFREIPTIPTIENQVVYVWGMDTQLHLKKLGYETRLVTDTRFDEQTSTEYGRKLVAMDMALKEFGEVLLMDWDCHILRPLDDNFYGMLSEKETQCPLYCQHKRTVYSLMEALPKYKDDPSFNSFASDMQVNFGKYSWTFGDGLATPNFGCVYSRDVNFAKDLIDISISNNITGCVEEHAMWIYAGCSMEEYIERYHPRFVQGVSDDRTDHEFIISKVQRALNKHISETINMDLYIKHI